jgi:type II secretory pathway pseudopilin PulG
MRGVIFAVLLAFVVPAVAQEQDRAAALDRAYDEVVAARAVLEQAEEARDRGIEPLPGERLGTVSPSGGRRSRLSEEYWQRQERLKNDVEQARRRLDEAVARWNASR